MHLKQDCNIILASTSKIRQEILASCNIGFKIQAPDFDEEKAKKKLKLMSSKEKAIHLACGKAISVSVKNLDAYVIGSDQICSIDGYEISKSKDKKEAFLQLKKLSGKSHFQNNAVVVAYNGKIIFKNFTKAKLKMRNLSDLEIKNYIEKDQAWGSAGSYKYESLGKYLFHSINGNYHAILGFNIQPLLNFFYNKKLISI